MTHTHESTPAQHSRQLGTLHADFQARSLLSSQLDSSSQGWTPDISVEGNRPYGQAAPSELSTHLHLERPRKQQLRFRLPTAGWPQCLRLELEGQDRQQYLQPAGGSTTQKVTDRPRFLQPLFPRHLFPPYPPLPSLSVTHHCLQSRNGTQLTGLVTEHPSPTQGRSACGDHGLSSVAERQGKLSPTGSLE